MTLVDRLQKRLSEIEEEAAGAGDDRAALKEAERLAEMFKDVKPEPYVIPANSLFAPPPAHHWQFRAPE